MQQNNRTRHFDDVTKVGQLSAKHEPEKEKRTLTLVMLNFDISGPEVIKLFSYSAQLSTKFILLINAKMPTIVCIFTFISMINTTTERLNLKLDSSIFVDTLVFMSS